jgi:hypothetical protein
MKIMVDRLRQKIQKCAVWQTINHKRIGIAPFDIVGDTMRGTKVVMLDMYQIPNKVATALETVTAVAIQMATSGEQGCTWLPQPGKRGFLYFDR